MTTPAGDDGSTPVEDLSYTEASRELDAIVGFFEQREVDVDQLVVRLERASAIVDELDRRVRQTRAQVEELVPRLEAVNRSSDDDSRGGTGATVTGRAEDGSEDDPSEETIGDAAGDGQALF